MNMSSPHWNWKQMIHNLPLPYNPALREAAQWKLRRLWPARCSVPPPASSRRSRGNTPLGTSVDVENYCNSTKPEPSPRFHCVSLPSPVSHLWAVEIKSTPSLIPRLINCSDVKVTFASDAVSASTWPAPDPRPRSEYNCTTADSPGGLAAFSFSWRKIVKDHLFCGM